MSAEWTAGFFVGAGFGAVFGGALVSAFFVIDAWWRFITGESRDATAGEGGGSRGPTDGDGAAANSAEARR